MKRSRQVRMRGMAAAVAVVTLVAACGGSGGAPSGAPATAGATTATTLAQTTPAPTTSAPTTVLPTTVMPTTGAPTTVAATTTTAAGLAVDASLARPLAAVTGYSFEPVGRTALTPFGWLGQVPGAPWYDRFAALNVTTSAGSAVGVLALYGWSAAVAGTESANESSFLSTIEGRIAADSGSAARHVVLGIETVSTGSDPLPWYAWFHDGIGYVFFGERASSVKAAASDITIALHEHPAYADVAASEGEGVLDARFVALDGGCGYGDVDPYFSASELVALADGWRAVYPYAQHFALRTVTCGSRGVIASISVVQMHREFAQHADVAEFMRTGLDGTVAVLELGGVPVAFGSDGALRFLYEGCLYQIASVTRNGTPLASYEVLSDIVVTIITTPVSPL